MSSDCMCCTWRPGGRWRGWSDNLRSWDAALAVGKTVAQAVAVVRTGAGAVWIVNRLVL
jgi:hypothetical protein